MCLFIVNTLLAPPSREEFPKDDIVPLRIIEIKVTAFVEDTERSSLGVFLFQSAYSQ